jgi:hypothetical protein
MSGHTSGPWRVEFDGDQWWIMAGEAYDDREGVRVIAAVAPDTKAFEPEEADRRAAADAHLLAAVPDLLAALKDYVALDESTPGAEAEPVFTQAREAIAKAKGDVPRGTSTLFVEYKD